MAAARTEMIIFPERQMESAAGLNGEGGWRASVAESIQDFGTKLHTWKSMLGHRTISLFRLSLATQKDKLSSKKTLRLLVEGGGFASTYGVQQTGAKGKDPSISDWLSANQTVHHGSCPFCQEQPHARATLEISGESYNSGRKGGNGGLGRSRR